MLLGGARPLHVEYLNDKTRLTLADFPQSRAKNYGECMAVAREAIQACWSKTDGAMQLNHAGDQPHYNLVRVLGANGREICSWSVADEQRHG
ncbi:hypothetical protein BH11PSE3_BH11PSE3_15330 [soil metagenome]